jgi:hypothetical protein
MVKAHKRPTVSQRGVKTPFVSIGKTGRTPKVTLLAA